MFQHKKSFIIALSLVFFSPAANAGIPTADFLTSATAAATAFGTQLVAEVQNRMGLEQTAEQKKQAVALAEDERTRAIKEGFGDQAALSQACVDAVSSPAPSPAKQEMNTILAVAGVSAHNFSSNPNQSTDAGLAQTRKFFCGKSQVDAGVCSEKDLCSAADRKAGKCLAAANVDVTSTSSLAIDMDNEVHAQALVALAANVGSNKVTAPPSARQMALSTGVVKKFEAAQARSSLASVSFMQGTSSSLKLANSAELIASVDMSNPAIKEIVDNHNGDLTQSDAYRVILASISSADAIAKEKGSQEASLQSIAVSNRLIAKLLFELYSKANLKAQVDSGILGTLTDILRTLEAKR